MNFTRLAVFLLVCSSVACSKKEPEEEKPVEQPVKKVAVRPAAPPAAATNPPSAFRILKSDTNLPTDAQLADGADSSIGSGQPVNHPGAEPSGPTAAIKPPAPSPSEPAPEDELAPDE